MISCEYCHIEVDQHVSKCPLCLRSIKTEVQTSANNLYPRYEHTTHARSFIFKLWLFCSISTIAICVLINLFTLQLGNNWWSLYIIAAVLYLWLLIGHTILSKSRVGAKIFWHTLGASTLLSIVDYNAGHKGWSVNFVVPFIVIAATIFITWKVYTKKMLWNEYIGYTIAMIFLGFIPILLYVVGISSLLWTSASTALNSVLTFAGMFIFANKRFKNEMKRRFHL